jgi:group I intron endonuclease
MVIDYTSIYSLADPNTGEIRYIGKSDNLKRRLREHLKNSCLTKSHRSNWIEGLKSALQKPKIDLIAIVKKDEWQNWECFYINFFKELGCPLTNHTIGGEGNKGGKVSEETKKLMSQNRLGKKHSIETKKLMSEAGKKRMTPEERQKYSKLLTGRKLADSTKQKLSAINSGSNNFFYGKHLTEEHKNNLRKSLVGLKRTEEQRLRISESHKKLK